jgi:FkbM family methyltransferase
MFGSLIKSARPETHTASLHGLTVSVPDALVTDSIVGKLADGSYERDEARAAMRTVKPGFRVLDLGGGIGLTANLAAERAGAANVTVVEANPALIPVIEQNLAANGNGEATVLHAAVTGWVPEGATGALTLAPGFTASSLKSKGPNTVEVPLVPITDLIRACRPHVIFMDVEGAEADLFKRAWKCPLRFMVVELHPKKYHARVIKRITDFMSEMDMVYDPATSRGRLLGFRKIWGGDEPPEDQTAG